MCLPPLGEGVADATDEGHLFDFSQKLISVGKFCVENPPGGYFPISLDKHLPPCYNSRIEQMFCYRWDDPRICRDFEKWKNKVSQKQVVR